MLEHRFFQRRSTILNVRLYKQGKESGTTCTVDLNSQGIGVECRDIDLREGEIVELDLPEDNIPDGMQSHVTCLVIHAGKVHCGLMLLDAEELG